MMPSFRFHTLAAIVVLILALIWVATGVFSSVGSAVGDASGDRDSGLATSGTANPKITAADTT